MKHIVVHGHFYQPPRENPWTGRVPREPSAAPHHDWNARILDECYRPNGLARLLDDERRIRDIVDNYEHFSFNFGPTLVDWMRQFSPELVGRLIEADRESHIHQGTGTALAQAYNHSILPLLSRDDKMTQVRWGLAHFKHMFGREAEGMWLPETAADDESLDVLAEAGVRFTILAPRQLRDARPDKETEFREPADVPRSQAFRYRTGQDRELAVFFYEEEISRAVAFERLLENGHALAERLEQGARGLPEDAPLLLLATDGETFGHHHRFGEMALATAVEELRESAGMELGNLASYLERHPPDLDRPGHRTGELEL